MELVPFLVALMESLCYGGVISKELIREKRENIMATTVDKVGVHTTHCCSLHGCKYGNSNCPVVLGTHAQEYGCEDCVHPDIIRERIADLTKQLEHVEGLIAKGVYIYNDPDGWKYV
jgi:hypothetical protein